MLGGRHSGLCDTDSFAQQSPVSPPPIRPMRQLEDYRYLARAGNRQGAWWERLKYIPIGESPYAPFLTLGGEVGLRYELIDNIDFGSGPEDNGGYRSHGLCITRHSRCRIAGRLGIAALCSI